MFTERTSVGLDVHARSVAAAAIDGVTGELVQTKLTPSYDHIRSWLEGLAGPVAVTYEAGPTGFGLYRSLTEAGVRCEVAAPSKLQKPSGDRVKTDARDAVHLARLLRLDEITKLLLRHGIVYYDGNPWTGKHDTWLRTTAYPQLTSRATQLTFDNDYEAMRSTWARRDRLDAAIEELAADSEFTPLVRRLGCLRGVSTLTGFALAVEISPVHRPHHRDLRRTHPGGALLRGDEEPRLDHQDRQRSRPPAAGRSSVAPPAQLHDRQDHARPLEPGTRHRQDPRGRRQPATAPTLGAVHRPPQAAQRRQHRDRSRTRRLVLVPGHPRRRLTSPLTASPETTPVAARGATRVTPMSRPLRRRSFLDKRSRSSRNNRPAVTNPRISD